MPEGQRPRGVTPRPRSGAAAESSRLRWGRNGREELPCIRGQGRQLRGDTHIRGQRQQREELPHVRGQGQRREELPRIRGRGGVREEIPHAPSLRPGAADGRSYLMPLSPKPRAAARRSNPTPEARGGGPGGPTPRPRSCGCAGTGGPRGAIPR